jgi:hypothetical protein
MSPRVLETNNRSARERRKFRRKRTEKCGIGHWYCPHPMGSSSESDTFFITFVLTLLIPMGVIIIYYLWKHGAQIISEREALTVSSATILDYGNSTGEE